MTDTPPPRVLIVEDDASLVRLYGRALEADGYEVEVAADGTEGLQRLRTAGFDVLVSDVCMPRMGGLDLAMHARTIDPKLPVVLMTATRDAEIYSRARAAGVVRYLLKPVTLEKLAKAVGDAVKLREMLVKIQERKDKRP